MEDEVATSQPSSGESNQNQWKHDLLSCCDDIPGCLCAVFLGPCYAFQTATAAGESMGCAVLTALFPIALCCVRGNAREKKIYRRFSSYGLRCHCMLLTMCHDASETRIRRLDFEMQTTIQLKLQLYLKFYKILKHFIKFFFQ